MKNSTITSLIEKIQSVLSPDLLHPLQPKSKDNHPMTGHCYAASEALYHMLGGRKIGLKPCVFTNPLAGSHWWLKDKNGVIIDPTHEQFSSGGKRGIKLLNDFYKNGRGTGFLTKGPSKRAREIIRRVKKLDIK